MKLLNILNLINEKVTNRLQETYKNKLFYS